MLLLSATTAQSVTRPTDSHAIQDTLASADDASSFDGKQRELFPIESSLTRLLRPLFPPARHTDVRGTSCAASEWASSQQRAALEKQAEEE